MARVAEEQSSAKQADSPAIRLSSQKEFWEASKKIQPDVAIPGYWDALEENCQQWATDLSVAPFWKAVKERQLTWSNEFQRNTSGALLARPGIGDFSAKRSKRVKEKLVINWVRAKRPAEVTDFWPLTGRPPIPSRSGRGPCKCSDWRYKPARRDRTGTGWR